MEKKIKHFLESYSAATSSNPFSGGSGGGSTTDLLEATDLTDYRTVVDDCRFFYRRDPLGATVLNKMIDIGVTDFIFHKNGLSENEFRVFVALNDKLREFAEQMALEYLLSGLVIPEVSYGAVKKDDLFALGIKKYPSLTLPISMWVRDPSTIKINKGLLSDVPSYFVEVPDSIVYFINNKGKFEDGTEDKELFDQLRKLYPDLIKEVNKGTKYIPLETKYSFRRRVLSDTAYPVPYLYPAIEPMKHKRNLRRMDYSIASRVISAIMLVKLGNDEYPVTEEDKGQFDDIKTQMMWRSSGGKDVERIFQLFGNHTLDISWVMPPVEALLDDTKYSNVNQDIMFALGFPRILITGESERSNSSDPQYATMSPVKTMENFRYKIEQVLQNILVDVANENRFKDAPTIAFKPLQLSEFGTFVNALNSLYQSGNLSRTSYAEFFGYNWKDEVDTRTQEQEVLVATGLPEFAPTPHSQNPENNQTVDTKKTAPTDKKETPPEKDTNTDENV